MSGIGQRVVVAPRAQRQVRKAIRWYGRQNLQAAAGLDLAFDAALELLAEAPRRWAELKPGVRRYLLPRYPYTLIYVVEVDRVVVLSVLHHARHPDTWRRDR